MKNAACSVKCFLRVEVIENCKTIQIGHKLWKKHMKSHKTYEFCSEIIGLFDFSLSDTCHLRCYVWIWSQ